MGLDAGIIFGDRHEHLGHTMSDIVLYHES